MNGQSLPLTFVVGTGRCGSTMLSRILHQHPEVLSVSEFMATLMLAMHGREIPAGNLDGRQLWKLLSDSDPFLDAMIRDGVGAPEYCYPLDRGRFGWATGIPRISHMTLPMLTEDPDDLFDRLAAEMPAWPQRPAPEQYRALFSFLAALGGRRVAVERSGSSLSLLPALRKLFPEARFVHMYRDGVDCALSMSRHPGFRLRGLAAEAARQAGPQPGGWKQVQWKDVQAALPDQFRGVLSPPFDAERFRNYPLPLTFFGRMWSSMICEGMEILNQLPADMRTSLKYEDLLADPDLHLSRLAAFLSIPPSPQWLGAAQRVIRARTRSVAGHPDHDTAALLRAACERGTQALESAAGGVTGAPR
jgi:hypothetical protein